MGTTRERTRRVDEPLVYTYVGLPGVPPVTVMRLAPDAQP